MQAFIITTFLGCFGVNENRKVVAFKPFPKEPKAAAEKLKLSEVEQIEEEKALQNDLWRKGYKEFIYPFRKLGVKKSEADNKIESFVKENLRDLAIQQKIVNDQAEFNQLLTRVNLELTKVKIKKAITRDNLIVHANGAMEELDKAINILVERLREWYGLHFPEMDKFISDHEKFAELVSKYGLRQNVKDTELSQIKDQSIGADLSEEDVKIIQSLASEITRLYELKEKIEKYVDDVLGKIAPNLKELAGSSLAAKLIAKTGGLERLAKMPSSTIQLLGAEKALFRHLHGHGKSPRFGFIFMHKLIQNAPEKDRGKIARVLASKMSIAVKMDFYSKEYNADKLKQELNERVKEILSSK